MTALPVAAIAFVAALAIGAWSGVAILTRHWSSGAVTTLTLLVPDAESLEPGRTGTRLTAVQALLIAMPEVQSTNILSDDQLSNLLQPWLGADMKDLTLRAPAVIAVRSRGPSDAFTALQAEVERAAPGTIVEGHARWVDRLGILVNGLRASCEFVLFIALMMSAATIKLVTRSELAMRRDTIAIVWQLGASHGYIARRFAVRAAAVAFTGGAIGGVLALLVEFSFATLTAPLAGSLIPAIIVREVFTSIPTMLRWLPAILAGAAAVLGYFAAELTVRRWLRHLS